MNYELRENKVNELNDRLSNIIRHMDTFPYEKDNYLTLLSFLTNAIEIGYLLFRKNMGYQDSVNELYPIGIRGRMNEKWKRIINNVILLEKESRKDDFEDLVGYALLNLMVEYREYPFNEGWIKGGNLLKEFTSNDLEEELKRRDNKDGNNN